MTISRDWKKLPMNELVGRLTKLVTEDDPENLADAFFSERHELESACREGMDALIRLANLLEIGWEISAGWRCDVPRDRVSVTVCDSSCGANPDVCFADIRAMSPQGALAAGILSIMQERTVALPTAEIVRLGGGE